MLSKHSWWKEVHVFHYFLEDVNVPRISESFPWDLMFRLDAFCSSAPPFLFPYASVTFPSVPGPGIKIRRCGRWVAIGGNCQKLTGQLSCSHAASENEGASAGRFSRSIGKESAGNLPGICLLTPDALQMPLWMLFPGGALADHLQGIYRASGGLACRCLSKKFRLFFL